MGIVFNNAIRNGGNVPKIQAATDLALITGQNNSLALQTTAGLLYYWNPGTLSWLPVNGSGNPNLESVLTEGNTATGIGIEITSANITVDEASLLARDVNLDRATIVNADGIIFGNFDLTDQFYVLAWVFGNPVQSITNSLGGTMELSPGANTGTIAVNYPKTSGNLYCIDLVEVTLINGIVTFNPGGESNLILGVGIKTASGTLGISYSWSGIGGSGAITITSLKTNGGVETSDNSVLYVTIAL